MGNSNSRHQMRRSKPNGLRRLVNAIQVCILIGISASVGIALAMFAGVAREMPNISNIEAPEASIIYSSDGVILARFAREDRENVDFKLIPKNLINATIAIEDRRFYQHSGVDLHGISRAIFKNLTGGRMAEGGSTITQQLARNVYLSQAKTLDRKIKEVALAILIENTYSKEKILELYLNRVYYGSGSFGVQAASRVYFGKSVEQLSLSQAALLAGLPKKPSGYSPHVDYEAAINRRDVVLNRMAELGFISPSDRDEAKKEHIRIVRLRHGRNVFLAPHFVDYVSAQIRSRYGEGALDNGGLRVYTTLNYKMQEIAEDALRRGVHRFESSRKVTEGAFIAIEPTNGFVRAMVGSVNPESQFNRCVQGKGRQPGSAFKAFVYAAAFQDADMKPSDRILDAPVNYPGANGEDWTPKNYDHKWHGMVTIRTAIAQSINIPAIKVAEQVGVETVIRYAKMMGIKSELNPYLSLAIGGIKGIHPIEMASAYGTFANNGVYVDPCSIIKVTDSKGKVVEDFTPVGKKVLTDETVDKMNEVLRAVVTRGTGTKAGGVKDAHGKTGTTNDDRDAWFVGYVPNELSAACWVGNDNYTSMRGAYGGQVCAPVWSEFMKKAIPILDEARDKKLDNTTAKIIKNKEKTAAKSSANTAEETVSLKICDESGDIATPKCPSWHYKKYLKGEEPQSYCTIHNTANDAQPVTEPVLIPAPEPQTPTDVTVQSDPIPQPQPKKIAPKPKPAPKPIYVTLEVCAESGKLASENCPKVIRKKFRVEDAPSSICDIHSGM